MGGHWLYRHNAKFKEWSAVAGRCSRATAVGAPAGQVQLEGTAQTAAETVGSPLYRVLCLAYTFEIQALSHTEMGEHRASVYSETKGSPFWFTDATGSVLVYPTPASKLELRDEPPHQASGGDQGNWLIQAMAALGLTPHHSGTYEFIERRLDPGEPCGIYGTYSHDVAGQPGVVQGEMGLFVTDSDTSSLLCELRKKRRLALLAVIGGGVELVVILPALLIIAAIFR